MKVLYKSNTRLESSQNKPKNKNQQKATENMKKLGLKFFICFGFSASSWINFGHTAVKQATDAEQASVPGALTTLQRSVDHFVDIDQSR